MSMMKKRLMITGTLVASLLGSVGVAGAEGLDRFTVRVAGDSAAGEVYETGRFGCSTLNVTPRGLSGTFSATFYTTQLPVPGTNTVARGASLDFITASNNNSTVVIANTGPGLEIVAGAGNTKQSGSARLEVVCSGGAGGGGGGSASTDFDVTDYGAVPDDGLTDVAGIQAAVDAACASSGERVVYIPPGDFDMGDDTETGFYLDSSVIIDTNTQCHGLTIRGAGRGLTRLLAESVNGQTMIAFCNFFLSDCNDVGNQEPVRDITISDLTFADLDNAIHGSQNSGYAFADAYVGDVPEFGDVVSWTGGTGRLHSYDAGRGLYVLERPLPTGTMTVPTGSLTGPGWTADNITSARGTRIEGTHGITTKYVEGMTIERVGCLDISDECIDLKVHSDNVVIKDIISEGVGRIGEGGATLSIANSYNVVLDGFYINTGTTSQSASGSAINIATNDPTRRPTRNVRILNGTIIEDSVVASERIEGGLTMNLSPSESGNDSLIEGLVISNITIDMPDVDAFIAGGNPALGDGYVVIANSTFYGGVATSASFHIEASNTRFLANSNVTSQSGFSRLTDVFFDATNAGSTAFTVLQPFTMVNSEIHGSSSDCMDVNTPGPVYITASTFRDCGLNDGGASPGDHAVNSVGAANNMVVTGNIKIGGNVNAKFRVGTTAGLDASCVVGAGADFMCGNNLVLP